MVLDCANGYQEEVKEDEDNCPPESFTDEEAVATAEHFPPIDEESSRFEKSCSDPQEFDDEPDKEQQSKSRLCCCEEESEEKYTPASISVFKGVFGTALWRGVGRFAGLVRC
jgi:hypothetical protein